ncbi:DUF5689 domain-containing protein [Puia sp. P3]|uniref:DUF5689 domain-containing protein n=1 Tax=Puia sp. P3 TaxID=3423952 RepID=UPI003D67C1C9
MKKLFAYSLLAGLLFGCKKDNYPGSVISPFVAIYDIRQLYKGADVKLTKDNMGGSTTITAMVVSDHSGGNMPAGLLVVQEARRLSSVRGISIPIGDDAAKYVPGDSVSIKVEGGVLKRVNGILEITGVPSAAIVKISSGNTIPINQVHANAILASPSDYESVLSVVVKGGFDPLPQPTDVLAGDKVLNDGFGNLDLHVEASSALAGFTAPFSANYYGIVFNSADGKGTLTPQLRPRVAGDVIVLSSAVTIASAVITGFASDVKGADQPYEYVQLMATRDIDFSVTPFSVVILNNANASTPVGYPSKGWATGDMRSFKLSCFSGFAAKGTFFYVGGSGKMINGAGSTSMAGSNWIRAFDYSKQGGDGFGRATTGLMANSGNAFGIAVFHDSAVDVNSVPDDCIFISGGGSLYTPGPPEQGYKINNTDFLQYRRSGISSEAAVLQGRFEHVVFRLQYRRRGVLQYAGRCL